jgi:hypothetical protein
MAEQREKVKVVDPFVLYMKGQGWHVEKLHGNAFQQGLPDCYCVRAGRQIFVEFKVIEDSGFVSYTDAQKRKFPALMGAGAPIYIIAARDLSGHDKKTILEIRTLYQQVINGAEPNGYKLFIKDLHKTLNPFQTHRIDHKGVKKL